MNQMLQITQLSFMLTAVWQDLNRRSIALWVYIVYGVIAFLFKILLVWGDFTLWMEMGKSMAVGIIICMISRLTKGAVGEGDGWFFVVMGIYLGLWDNITLLLYGLLFCSLFSLGIIMWGIIMNVDVSKKRLPFLPFLLAPGIWLVML